MGSASSTSVSVAQPSNTTVTIFNVAVGAANLEVNQALPVNCKGFIIRSRGLANMKLSYTSGDSGTLYLTVRAGSTYEDLNYYDSQTLYFQLDAIGLVEILAYS